MAQEQTQVAKVAVFVGAVGAAFAGMVFVALVLGFWGALVVRCFQRFMEILS